MAMKETVVTLDVREALKRGQEPFSLIMQAVGQLEPGHKFLLIVPFEPMPLYQIMAQRGFTHEATGREDGDWEILFSPGKLESGADGALENPVCERRARGEFK